jgi:hypothetical protein
MALGGRVGRMNQFGGSCILWTLQTVRERCEEVGECWMWQGACKTSGIPQARVRGKGGVSLRSFINDTLMEKRRPKSSVMTTMCGEKLCLNPKHLAWSTKSARNAYSYASGARGPKSELVRRGREMAAKNGWTRLTMDKATEIRVRAVEEPKKNLAVEFGVSVGTIRAIVRGKLWRSSGPFSVFNLGAAHA